MGGGPLFLRDPACAVAIGADAAAEDGRSAVRIAGTLVAHRLGHTEPAVR